MLFRSQNATNATSASTLANGVSNQIVYQTGPGSTSFLGAPTTANTVLGFDGTNITWVAQSVGTGTVEPVVFPGSPLGARAGGTISQQGRTATRQPTSAQAAPSQAAEPRSTTDSTLRRDPPGGAFA